jgi:uncharacterized membrane protein YebE (DUF533 family)
MKNIFKSIGVILMIAIACNVNAQTIKQTQVNQQRRIVEGERTGQITPAEAKRLENEQRRIQAEKRVARADGHVSPRERRIIKTDQRRASRDIYRAKVNAAHQ